jgi:hypothetical protein
MAPALDENYAEMLPLSGSIPGKMRPRKSTPSPRAGITEEHFSRLSRVARATRQGWAATGLLSPQTSPYSLEALHEVVVYARLRDQFSASADVVWAQAREGLASVVERRPIELIVDCHLLRAAWVLDDSAIAQAARSGNDVRLIDLTDIVVEATAGFDLVMATPRRTAAPPGDQLAARRATRSTDAGT